MSVSWIEKRRSPRINAKVPLRYQIRGKPEYSSAISGNLSISGLGFINDQFIAPNNCLNIEINLPAQVINAVGRVTRADSLRGSDRYCLGVEFLEMDRRQKSALSDYLGKRIGS